MIKWKTIDRKRVKHIRKGQRILARQFRSIRATLTEQMKGAMAPEHLIEIVEKFSVDKTAIRQAYYDIHTSAGVEFAAFTASMFKSSKQNIEKKDLNDDIQRSIWFKKMIEYVDSECGSIIQDVTKATYNGIVSNTQKAIRLAAENGWGAEKTSREIMKLQGNMDRYRAMRIARTEVVRASNKGISIGADNIIIPVVKVWIAADDERTRQGHGNVQPVERNEPFKVNGEDLMYPGDPAGSAGNTIQCRCTYGHEPKEQLI